MALSIIAERSALPPIVRGGCSRNPPRSIVSAGFSWDPILCDYELRNTAPRRIQTAITLCALYGLPLQTSFEAMKIKSEDTGTEPMEDQLVPRASPAVWQSCGAWIPAQKHEGPLEFMEGSVALVT